MYIVEIPPNMVLIRINDTATSRSLEDSISFKDMNLIYSINRKRYSFELGALQPGNRTILTLYLDLKDYAPSDFFKMMLGEMQSSKEGLYSDQRLVKDIYSVHNGVKVGKNVKKEIDDFVDTFNERKVSFIILIIYYALSVTSLIMWILYKVGFIKPSSEGSNRSPGSSKPSKVE